MTKWNVHVEKVIETEFIMTEDELEGESPEYAAEELSLSIPSNHWDEIDSYVTLTEIKDA